METFLPECSFECFQIISVEGESFTKMYVENENIHLSQITTIFIMLQLSVSTELTFQGAKISA